MLVADVGDKMAFARRVITPNCTLVVVALCSGDKAMPNHMGMQIGDRGCIIECGCQDNQPKSEQTGFTGASAFCMGCFGGQQVFNASCGH